MRIGAALVLLAVGAILRFALTTVITHGVYLHTVGDILMGVGVLGLVLWVATLSPRARSRSTTTRRYTSAEGDGHTREPGTYVREEHRYEDQYPG